MNRSDTTLSVHGEDGVFRLASGSSQGRYAVIQDGHIRLCSASLAGLLGYSREELASKSIAVFLHPDHRDSMTECYSRLLAGRGDQCPEFRAVAASGAVLWLGRTGVPVEWDGKPAVLDFFSDITERKRVELDLRESHDRLALTLDIVKTGIWDWRVDTGAVHVNPAWFTMLGYRPDEFPWEIATWQLLVHPDDLPEAQGTVARHLQSALPFDISFRMRTKSGDYRWINSKGQVVERDASGSAVRMIGTHSDITEQVQAEAAIRESGERLKAFQDGSSGGIAIHDKGVVLDCNSRLSEITGYPKDELIGMDGLLAIAEKSRGEVMRRILGGYEKPYEVFGLRKNGEEYPLQLQARNVSHKGKMVRVVEFRDITESRRAQEEQALLKARLVALWQVSRMVEADYASLCDMMLREAQAMTSSKHSFFGFVGKDNESMTLQTWSPEAKAECCVGDRSLSFPIHRASMWFKAVTDGRRVIVNDYENASEYKRGLPEGHVPIRRLLMVPIVRNGVVTALAALANKPDEYTEEDAAQISAFVTSVMLLLERRQMEDNLKESQEKLSMALEMAFMGQWELDLRTQVFTFNEPFYRLYGTSGEREGGMFMPAETYTRNFVHPDEIEVVSSEISKVLNGEYNERQALFEHRIVRRDGEVRNIVVQFAVLEDESGRPVKTIGVNQDITPRKRAEEELANQRRRLEDIIEGTNVGTWEWNVQTGETVFNERWAGIVGYTLSEISPTSIDTWLRFVHPDDMAVSAGLLERHFRGEIDHYECEARMKHRNGDWVWVLDRGKVASWTEDGAPLLMSGTHQDITAKKLTEEKIRHLATHDPMTDLPSLRLARDRIGQALSMARRKGWFSAVLFVDLDGFKTINDEFGHDAGDALLKEIAARLKLCVRGADTIARIGGDEFLVVLSELRSREDAGLVADKIVKSVGAPFTHTGNMMQAGASVGVAVYDGKCGEVEAGHLIKQADKAMYVIKKSGKNGFAYADDGGRPADTED